MKLKILFIATLILIGICGIDIKWFDGVNLIIYEYGNKEDSR